MEWQPIETSPIGEDHPVLVWDGSFITVAHRVVHKDGDPRRCYDCWYVHNSYGFNEDGCIYGVTHWMPLPAPPQEDPENV